MRRGPRAVDARPIAHGASGLLEFAGLPESERHQAQHRHVAWIGVARIDQPPRRELVLAFGHRPLRCDQETLDTLRARVGL